MDSQTLSADDPFELTANAWSKALNPIGRYLTLFSSILTIGMAVIVLTDISTRIFFNFSIAGSLEIQQYLLAALVFLALPYATMQKNHVNIDLIFSTFSKQKKLVFESIFYLLSAYLFFIISWQNLVRFKIAIEDREIGFATGVPLSIFIFITLFGCTLVMISFISEFLKLQFAIKRSFYRPLIAFLQIYSCALVIMIAPLILRLLSINLPSVAAGLLGMAVTLVIMLLGMQIAFALGLMGFLGLWYLSGSDTALQIVRMSVFDSVANYFFCVVPFFVLMGFLAFRSGLSNALYQAGHKIFGQLPGGLGIGTVFGCAGFASICGDSMATAGTMGSVAYPEMKKYGYKPAISTCSVAAGGTLGILIPPSMGFVIYGLIAEQSIGKLFMAGIIPGILLTIAFSTIILIRCKIDPSLGPPGPKATYSDKIRSLIKVWPILLMFIVVIGGIYSGIFTPTEAGGVGMVIAFLIGVLQRRLDRNSIMLAFIEAMALVSVIFGILIGVTILGYFITVSEIPMTLSNFIVSLNLSKYYVLLIILLLYLILGMVMNIIPMIMITLPILFPTIVALGFDPIWFGVIMVIMMEAGQITPPVGVNVFVIASVAKDVPMATIFKGVLPFVLAMFFIIFLLILFPDLALILPGTMETLPSISD